MAAPFSVMFSWSPHVPQNTNRSRVTKDMKAGMIIIVYRETVQVCIDPSFAAEATLKSMNINSLMDALTQAAKQAHGDTKP